MNGEKRMEEDIIQRKKNLIMFPLGTIGRDMVYNLVTSYLLTYVLFTRALTAAQLAAISAIMVGARVFDALNDPIMGNIIERTRTRWGKLQAVARDRYRHNVGGRVPVFQYEASGLELRYGSSA